MVFVCIFIYFFIYMYQNCSKLQVKIKQWTEEAKGARQQGATCSAGWVIVGFSGGRERVTQVRPSLRELSGKLSGCGRVAGPWCHWGGRRREKQLIKASASFSPRSRSSTVAEEDGRPGEGKHARGENACRGPLAV